MKFLLGNLNPRSLPPTPISTYLSGATIVSRVCDGKYKNIKK